MLLKQFWKVSGVGDVAPHLVRHNQSSDCLVIPRVRDVISSAIFKHVAASISLGSISAQLEMCCQAACLVRAFLARGFKALSRTLPSSVT